ncbi:MAG TPA: hypothetical protein VE465_25835 [Streptosporangiaceae bacterium]|nr:hypothetical protein [Streptosporangiaceae bacterium]
MDHELVGIRPVVGRLRPMAGGAFAMAAFVVALLPVRPTWLWSVLIVLVAALPWGVGAVVGPRRAAPYWRLTAGGLERLDGRGGVTARYEHRRIEELAVTAEDGVLTVFHRFGRVTIGELNDMGLEPLPLFVMARRFGVPIHVLDADASTFSDDDEPAPGRVSERQLLDQEAKLLAAAHDPAADATSAKAAIVQPAGLAATGVQIGNDPTDKTDSARPPDQANQPDQSDTTDTTNTTDQDGKTGQAPAGGVADPGPAPVRLDSSSAPARGRLAALSVLTALLSVVMIVRIAVDGAVAGGIEFTSRLAAGGWVLVGSLVLIATRRRLARTTPVRWEISSGALRVRSQLGDQEVAATDVAAVVLGPGLTVDGWTGEPKATPLAALVFGYRQELLARLPAGRLDQFQLAHALDEHGYNVVASGGRALKPSEYGLDGLPDVFAQVPGGRLVVHERGLGWADAAGDVVLRMPGERIGGIELLTIGGHAWLRVYDAEGEEFFAAPLSVLRIARTELRESARRAGLSVTDAEYDAYLNAAFHGTVSAFATAIEPGREGAPEVIDIPVHEPGVLLDATWRSRVLSAATTMVVCEVVSVLGALWLSGDVGGFVVALAWAAPAGLLLGIGGSWLYDRNRSQLRISPAGITSITRRGRVEWNLLHETVGGVGVDDSEQGLPRLVIWSPAGRVLRRVSVALDLRALRRACERYGLPWGPPAAGLPKPPPPEL